MLNPTVVLIFGSQSPSPAKNRNKSLYSYSLQGFGDVEETGAALATSVCTIL